MVEEALGIDDTKGALAESMEEIQEEIEEIQEEIGAAAEQPGKESTEKLLSDEELNPKQTDITDIVLEQEHLEKQPVKYKSIDMLI